ncbi:conserved hypothetical protein [Streptomyces clavuligerus]|nr:conserved hypothetical protein [Streptomyces clavuligerus]
MGGEFGFTPERLAMSNSSTALLIGDTAQAEVAAERALALIDTRAEGSLSAAVRGGASADLALARLLGNDVDGAAEALKNVWTVRPEQRGTGLLARTAQVRRLLAVPHMYGTPLAMELCDRIENFIHTSASRQIGVGASDVLALES